MRTASFVISLLLLLPLVGPGGCSTAGGPRMTGFALGDTRIVSVGDVIDLEMPLGEDGNRRWRVTSWDSLFLSISRRPGVIEGSDGKPALLAQARARTPGETVIEVTEVNTGGARPKVVTFKVRIKP